jgi:hypothetical protein
LESVLEKPSRTDVKKSKPKVRFPGILKDRKPKLKKPQFTVVKCLFSNEVILVIRFRITDGYVYDSL